MRSAAETTVEAKDEAQGRSEVFGILAGYIFGKNRERRELAMTAPVLTESSRALALTAPVEARQGQSGSLTMRFFLPPGVTTANAPVPNDDRVKLVEVAAETLAVLRFSGSWADDMIADRQELLIRALQTSAWSQGGKPFALFYDPPFTLPFLRRNEVAVKVQRA